MTTEAEARPEHETLHATRNALKLGASLIGTWGIALVMRFFLPRYLGPDQFGALSFADAFAATAFVALGLGVDVYVRKEVSVRPAHASDFFGGAAVLRAAASAILLAAMALVLSAMDRPPEVRRAVYAFAVAQFFVTQNATLSAMLHAKGRVGGMSVLAVATKVLWAGGVVVSIAAHLGLVGLAVAFLVPEAIECGVLFALARRHLGLAFRVDASATKAIVVLSLPFYVNAIATTAYGKLDVTLLAVLADSREVGFYAAASALAGLSLLVTPLIGWVLMPTLARAASRSHDEFFERLGRSTELILSVAIPVALVLGLGADRAVRLLFGDAYAPAGAALRVLAPTFVVTYVAIVYAISLIMLERAWTLAVISTIGLGVNVGLNVVVVPRAIALLGEGGGGVGCALAMLGTEVFVTCAMVSRVGARAIDRRTVAMVTKSLAACGAAVVVDRLFGATGWAGLVLDLAVYLALVIATRALRVGEIWRVVAAALRIDSGRASRPPLAGVATEGNG